MDEDNNFLYFLKYSDDYKEISNESGFENLKDAYILCKFSFSDQNFNIANFFKNNLNMKIPKIIKLSFTFNEIISFKKKKIDFYIISKERLINILQSKGINMEFGTNSIYFADKKEHKILYFINENKYISFKVKNNHISNINNHQNIFVFINKI